MNFKAIRFVLSWVLKIEALCMLLPLICGFCYGENQNIIIWIFSIGLCLLFGFGICLKTPANKTMYAKEGFVSVALSWIVMSIFGAVPFVLSGTIPSFVDAVFETVSGFTTTGASIMPDVESAPKSMLFWRSFTHWIGGMGVLVFITAFIPLKGSGNFQLIKAESPGPSVSKLVPKAKSTAKILYGIYLFITLLQITLLFLGGMSFFDSVTLTFGTVGTGGFGVRNSGIADYSSYSQIVITVFMILCGIDFSVYYLLLMRKFKAAVSSSEVRCYLGIIVTAIILVSISIYPMFGNLFDTVKHSAFQVGSIITTTGYSTVDFNLWPEFSKAILVILMFIGACAGSTGGGIKVSRIMILLKSIVKEIRILAHPKSTLKIKLNGRVVEHETVRAVNVFLVAYLAVYAFSLLVISVDNLDFTSNFTAVAATINNIGPGLAAVGPVSNFSAYSPLSTVVLIFDMLIGRLEVFPILLLFSPYTWKK